MSYRFTKKQSEELKELGQLIIKLGSYEAAMKQLGKGDVTPLEESKREQTLAKPELDPGEKLMLNYFKKYDIVERMIRSYDKFYSIAADIIKNTMLRMGNKQVVVFDKVVIESPAYKDGLLTPQRARTLSEDYYCPIIVDARVYSVSESKKYDEDGTLDPKGGKLNRNILLDKIPCMLNSSKCYLQSPTTKERGQFIVEAGEDPGDPFGYFISKGAEHVILNIESLRKSVLVIYEHKEGTRGTLTLPDPNGTANILTGFDKDGNLVMTHSRLKVGTKRKENEINIFYYFALLDIVYHGGGEYDLAFLKKSYRRAENLILSLIPSDYRNNVSSIISPPYTDPDPYKALLKFIKTGKTEKEKKDFLDDFMKNTFFSHIGDEETIGAKFHLLALMAARMYLCRTGLIKHDDRDVWANKSLSGPARKVEHYFRRFWRTFVNKFALHTPNGSKDLSWPPDTSDKMWKSFESSFSTGNWGDGKKTQQNVSQRIKRDNTLTLWAHLTTIDVPADKTNQASTRALQADQYGYICTTFTTEGQDTGLRKAKAITEYETDAVSPEINEKIIASLMKHKSVSPLDYEFKNDFVRGSKKSPLLLVYNYRPIAWADATIADYCRKERRFGRLPRDIEVVEEGAAIYLYTDEARPVRPVLFVDENHELLIDKLKLRDKSIDDIMEAGAIDFLTPREQSLMKVAVFPKDINALTQEREKLAMEVKKYSDLLDLLGTDIWESKENVPKELASLMLIKSEDERNHEIIALQEKFEKEYERYTSLLNIRRQYTHCELDPTSQFGVSALFIPLIQHNPAARNVYQTSMNRQALSNWHTNQKYRTDTEKKALLAPQRPMFNIAYDEHFRMNIRPHANNVVIAFMTGTPYTLSTTKEAFTQQLRPGPQLIGRKETIRYEYGTEERIISKGGGWNQEDGITVKRQAVQRGLFMSTIYHTYDAKFIAATGMNEYNEKPQLALNEDPGRYHAIDEKGMPIIGRYVRPRDCVIGRVLHKMVEGVLVKENKSVYVENNEEGYIENVIVEPGTHNNHMIITVKIAQTGYFREGNKIAAIPAQKGTVNFVDDTDLPRTVDGLTPDVIINPQSLWGRQTMTYIIELLAGKATVLTGTQIDATAFRNLDLPEIIRTLSQIGVNFMGYEVLFHPVTGLPLPNKIYLGIASLQVLRHFAHLKMQGRGWSGQVNARTGQPTKPGSQKTKGGNRSGEQERDAYISHGAAGVINQVLYKLSDCDKIPVCVSCNMPVNRKYNTMNYYCNKCNGRDFSLGQIRHATVYTNYIASALGIGTELTWSNNQHMKPIEKGIQEFEDIGEEDYAEDNDDTSLD